MNNAARNAKQLGVIIRRERKSGDLLQKQFGETIGLRQATISKLERVKCRKVMRPKRSLDAFSQSSARCRGGFVGPQQTEARSSGVVRPIVPGRRRQPKAFARIRSVTGFAHRRAAIR